jgi:hypothetical protein
VCGDKRTECCGVGTQTTLRHVRKHCGSGDEKERMCMRVYEKL